MSDIRQDNEGYRRFRSAMQDGKLQPGMVVTQNELCDLLGLAQQRGRCVRRDGRLRTRSD